MNKLQNDGAFFVLFISIQIFALTIDCFKLIDKIDWVHVRTLNRKFQVYDRNNQIVLNAYLIQINRCTYEGKSTLYPERVAVSIRASDCDLPNNQWQAVIATLDKNRTIHLLPATLKSIENHFVHELRSSQLVPLMNLMHVHHRRQRQTNSNRTNDGSLSHWLYRVNRSKRSTRLSSLSGFCGTRPVVDNPITKHLNKFRPSFRLTPSAPIDCEKSKSINDQLNVRPPHYQINLGVYFDEFFSARLKHDWPTIQLNLKLIVKGMETYFRQSDVIKDVGLIQFVTVKIGRYRSRRQLMGQKLLENFCIEQSKFLEFFNTRQRDLLYRPNVNMLFTGLNMFEQSDRDQTMRPFLEGIALDRSLCSLESCILVRRLSLECISTTAHELAHVLGARHDDWSLPCSCDPHAFLMSNSSALHKQTFSECSKWSMNQFLRTMNCLPKIHSIEQARKAAERDLLRMDGSFDAVGDLLDPDLQCSIAYNGRFRALPEQTQICSGLICHNELFGFKKFPALDGTICARSGDHVMRCCSGVCQLSCHHDFLWNLKTPTNRTSG